MTDKTFKIVDGDLSDGYHTFDELYEHRCLLYLVWLVEEKKHSEDSRQVFYVADHFEGWDLVATNIGSKQISYHVPSKYRDILQLYFIRRTSLEETFDGHTSKDVLQRMSERLRS